MSCYRPYRVAVVGRRRVSPSFVRLTLAGDDLGSCSRVLLDQRVKLLFGTAASMEQLLETDDWYAAWGAQPEEDRATMRTYTLVDVRCGADGSGEVDIDIVVHEAGETLAEGPAGPDDAAPNHAAPGMSFALEAPVGTTAVLVAAEEGREGSTTVGVAWHPGQARDVLLVGDETALPAIANIAGSLDPGMTGRVVVEVPQSDDVRTLCAPCGVEVCWKVRALGERAQDVFGAHGEFASLRMAVDEDDELVLWDEPDLDQAQGLCGRYGWVAGEAGWVRSLRAEARAAAVPKGQVAFMGYWKRGQVGA